jgi:hypothetical protein
MKLTIEITGDDWYDLELAVEEVLRLVEENYLSGFNRNETGSYRFDIEGQPVSEGEQ